MKTPEDSTTNRMYHTLSIMMYISAFVNSIYLLNMLVAIMANRQMLEKDEEVRTRLRYQLSLIIDFWVYNPFTNSNKKYLVTAKHVQTEHRDDRNKNKI